MGLLFIAAGNKKNRFSLEKSYSIDQLRPYLSEDNFKRLVGWCKNNKDVFLWGATNDSQLKKVTPGDYALDTNKKTIEQIFTFCFYIETNDNRLQNFIEWEDKDGKPYKYVYFLISPHRINKNQDQSNKGYFGKAFGYEKRWLQGISYLDDERVSKAMMKFKAPSIEAFIGLKDYTVGIAYKNGPSNVNSASQYTQKAPQEKQPDIVETQFIEPPDEYKELIEQIMTIKNGGNRSERDREGLVEELFVVLKYKRGAEIIFQRGRIDVLIIKSGKPLITIEVKRKMALSSDIKNARKQAFNYALELGSKYVIITNGDYYLVYDRTKGLDYDEHFLYEFTLTRLTEKGLRCVKLLTKGILQ